MGKLGCEIVDLDFPSPMKDGREKMGEHQVLLGNINPVAVLLDGSVQEVLDKVAQCHREAGCRFIVGAGCEVPRDTPKDNLLAMLEFAKSVHT